jgi:hypothetical protein
VELSGSSLIPTDWAPIADRAKPHPSWSHRWKKKVWSKASNGPALPLLDSLFPCQPYQPSDNEVALPNREIQYLPIQLRRFSRCRRPSLSSKRPLRACQLTPARLQSSSLNEIPNSARPSTKFSQTFTVSSPFSAPGNEVHARRDKRESAFELKSNRLLSQAHVSWLGSDRNDRFRQPSPSPSILLFAAFGPPPC